MLAFKKEITEVEFVVLDNDLANDSTYLGDTCSRFNYFSDVQKFVRKFYPRFSDFEFYIVFQELMFHRKSKIGKYIITIEDA